MRSVPSVAASFVSQHEGLRLSAYKDSGGVATIGYGHTGPDVKPGLTITKEHALQLLTADLAKAAARLHGVVAHDVLAGLTENQYAALLSFVFNLGAGVSWKIWRALNERRFADVPDQMMRFVYVGKTRLRGLVYRRASEVALWKRAASEIAA